MASSSTDKKAGRRSRPPIEPSARSLHQLITKSSELINSMTVHLRAPHSNAERFPAEPTIIAFVQARQASVQDFIAVASSRDFRSWGGFVLLRWPDGFSATLQIAYLKPPETSAKARWVPLSLASGPLARILLNHAKGGFSRNELVIVSIPFLRLQALVHFSHQEAGVHAAPAVFIVQPGITQISSSRKRTLAGTARLVSAEFKRLSGS